MAFAPDTLVPTDATGRSRDFSRVRWAGLAGRERAATGDGGRSFVFLHGLTFDRHMWDPVLESLPERHRAVAFDLPGHGASGDLDRPGLDAVVAAVREAVLEAGLECPILVGHSIGGPIAAIYASEHETAGVVSIEAPLRLEPFAGVMQALRPQLAGTGFDRAWASFRNGMGLDHLPPSDRALVRERVSRRVVLSYQWDLLERPLDEIVRWRDEGMRRVAGAGVPYVSLHSAAVDPADQAFLAAVMPQAEIVVWPVPHHFPHIVHHDRLTALLTGLAAGSVPRDR